MTIDLRAVMEATWPAANTQPVGAWLIREGQGGGQRVMAASPRDGWQPADLPQAEAAMRALGQPLIFVIYPEDQALDAVLEAEGYGVVDPVVGYAGAIADMALPPPEYMTTFPHWPPMAIAETLWEEGGIGPARLAVMARVQGPKTAILSRVNDRAAGVAFVAIHDGVAMLHALEVTPSQRQQGSAHNILRAAVTWAQDNGAHSLSLVVTEANAGARALYASVGLGVVGQYHYRRK
ncbi:MAG: GNAT family N-acetyltransferase [Cypionkella sp.]